MATLDELVVRIKADASQLERELRRTSSLTRQSAGEMASAFGGLKRELLTLVPALSAGALVAFGKRAVDAAGQVVDLGQRIGFAADTLAALEAPLATTGTSLQDFAATVNLMNANVGQAVSGNAQMAEAFDRLGLSLDELKRLAPEDQFYLIADTLARVGTQYEQTELGRQVFGRGFASMLPLIKEANGDLRETVDAIKQTGDALSGETLNRIDAFGDAMSRAAILAKNEFLETLAVVLKVADAVAAVTPSAEELTRARMSNYGVGSGGGIGDTGQARMDAYLRKARAGGFVTEPSVLGSQEYGPNQVVKYQDAFGPSPRRKASAASSGVSEAERRRQEAERERAAIIERNMTAYERFVAGTKRANALLADDQEQLNRELQRVWQDYADSGVQSLEEVGEAGVVNAKLLKDSFADALEEAMFDFENFGDAAGNILEGIARNVARSKIINPLSDALGGVLDESGVLGSLGDFFGGFFADGGRPPVGRPSVVGERGPEIFVPDSAGTVVPNHALGGQSVSVSHTWNIASGVTRQELAALIPVIEARSRAGMLREIQRGGDAARIVRGN